MIPKVMHYIWLGSELPDWARLNIDSFKRHHPDFEIVLHTDRGLLDKRYETLFANAEAWAPAVDLLRFSILRQQGGYYADTDVLFLNRIPDFADEGKILRSPPPLCGALSITLLACRPGLPIWDYLAQRIIKQHAGCRKTVYYSDAGKMFARMAGEHPESFSVLPGKYAIVTDTVAFYTYCREHGYEVAEDNPPYDDSYTAIHCPANSRTNETENNRIKKLEHFVTMHM